MVSFSKSCFPGDHSHLWVSFPKTELPRALPKRSGKIQFFIVSNKSLFFNQKGSTWFTSDFTDGMAYSRNLGGLSPLQSIQQTLSILKEISPEYSLERTDAEAEAPIFWPPDTKKLTHWKRP